MRKISILNLITFLAAFLLFQIELIITKTLLPSFGGSYLVWGSCVVFFQAVLFLGYFSAYAMLKRVGLERAKPFYLGLFLLPLFTFPGRGLFQITSVNPGLPLVLNVFWHLLLTIGPVFFALSTTSVILQSWLADSDLPEKHNPYTLYALSNLGSFAALISYPFLIELFLKLNQQLLLWRVMYFTLLGLIIFAVLTIKVKRQELIGKILSIQGVSRDDCLRWLLFSAAGVIMFLAVTNIVTYEIAPIPLLWVVPLCIYLLSFVLNFKQKPWAPAWLTGKFYLTFAWSIVLYFFLQTDVLPFILEVAFIYLFLFHTCMFCQYHLNRTKPADLSKLPVFYLIISAGGFIGGLIATWIMPLVSVSILEYLLGLVVIALALNFQAVRQSHIWRRSISSIVCISILLICWPLLFREYNLLGIIAIFFVFKICYSNLIKFPRALLLSTFMILLVSPLLEPIWGNMHCVYRYRNYYGVNYIYDEGQLRMLAQGMTIHGVQFKDKQRENQPLGYYHKSTPVGGLLSSDNLSFENIGVMGLGSGGLAVYNRNGQEMDYFEIDPDMYFVARDLFTYLKNAKGKVNLIFGDARQSIKKTQEKRYDILIMDAFNSDAPPVHLLTTDALNEYRRHLKDNGIILIHISNRYLNFIPVLLSNANYLNAYACAKENADNESEIIYASTWFALTWDGQTYEKLIRQFSWGRHKPGKNKFIRPWTDEYSNMLLILKPDNLRDSLKQFNFFTGVHRDEDKKY